MNIKHIHKAEKGWPPALCGYSQYLDNVLSPAEFEMVHSAYQCQECKRKQAKIEKSGSENIEDIGDQTGG